MPKKGPTIQNDVYAKRIQIPQLLPKRTVSEAQRSHLKEMKSSKVIFGTW